MKTVTEIVWSSARDTFPATDDRIQGRLLQSIPFRQGWLNEVKGEYTECYIQRRQIGKDNKTSNESLQRITMLRNRTLYSTRNISRLSLSLSACLSVSLTNTPSTHPYIHTHTQIHTHIHTHNLTHIHHSLPLIRVST